MKHLQTFESFLNESSVQKYLDKNGTEGLSDYLDDFKGEARKHLERAIEALESEDLETALYALEALVDTVKNDRKALGVATEIKAWFDSTAE